MKSIEIKGTFEIIVRKKRLTLSLEEAQELQSQLNEMFEKEIQYVGPSYPYIHPYIHYWNPFQDYYGSSGTGIEIERPSITWGTTTVADSHPGIASTAEFNLGQHDG